MRRGPRRRRGRCSTRTDLGGRSRPSVSARRVAPAGRTAAIRRARCRRPPDVRCSGTPRDAIEPCPYGRIGVVAPPPDLSRRSFLAVGGGLAFAGIAGWPAVAAATEPTASKALSALLVSNDLYVSPQPQRGAFVGVRGPTPPTGSPARLALAPPGSNQGQV